MIDTRKVWIAAAIAVVIVAALVALIVFGTQSVGQQVAADRTAAARASKAAASATPTLIETPAEAQPSDDAYDEELSATDAIYKRASTAALAASRWDGAETAADRKADYTKAGIAADLAATYKPVWASVFGNNITAAITTQADGQPGLNSVTGTDGHRQYRLGVTVIYRGSWTANGKSGSQDPATATWWVTVDEATGKVTAIDQPRASDLQIRIAS